MATFQERMELRTNLLTHKMPNRIFIAPNFALEAAASLAGIDLIQIHYNPELREQAYEKLCETFYSDTMPVSDLRFPASYQILGAKNWILGSNGAVQHPEIETLQADEYDEFIADPYTCIVEKLMPRVCANLDTDPINRSFVLAKGYASYKECKANEGRTIMKLSMKYGYAPGFITNQLIEAPFDFLADQLRGFKATTMDVRRMPDKVEAAVNAILPLMIKLGTPKKPGLGVIDFIPLHLAPYINMKQFDRLFWPTLEKLVVELDKGGTACELFCEQDWTRFAEYLEKLPASAIYMFEDGDYKKLKETAGKNHLIGGFYDPTITLTKSKEECIDEAKRLIDVCAPGGKFFFSFNKGVMDIKSIDVSKLAAVLEWVRDYGIY